MNASPMSLVILESMLAFVAIRGIERKRVDLPPYNYAVEDVAPYTRNGGAKLVMLVGELVGEQAADLVIQFQLVFRGLFLVVFKTVKPQAENDHHIHAAEWVFDAPVGSGGCGNPVQPLNSSDFNALEALGDDLVHFLGPLDLFAGDGHGCCDLVGRVVAKSFLDRLEVNF